jgi:hypothetical protein
VLARIDVVREALRQRDDVVEVQVQYSDGDVTSFQVDEQSGASAAEQLESFLSSVDWDRVKEVELEYANEEEHEIDFEELEDSDDDDDDDEDEDEEDRDETPDDDSDEDEDEDEEDPEGDD